MIKKQNTWIEIVAVLFIVCVLSFDFSSIQNFNFMALVQKVPSVSVDIDNAYIRYTANVSGGLDIVKEELNNIDFSIGAKIKDNILFIKKETTENIQMIKNAYRRGLYTIKDGSMNYANTFSSNLLNNLGVIERQLHTAKTNFCK